MDTLELTQQIRALRQMSVGELRARYAEVFGEENRSRNKDYLVRRIAWRIQTNASGGISERARLRAQELANEADLRVCQTPRQVPTQQTVTEALNAPYSPPRDPRLPPPGTVLTREFKGQVISVLVEHDSFRWNGQPFKSLSAIAREVTGKSWNGFIFFKCAQQS
jgi:hypothetical protein